MFYRLLPVHNHTNRRLKSMQRVANFIRKLIEQCNKFINHLLLFKNTHIPKMYQGVDLH